MLADKDLLQLINSNVLTDADPQRVGPVSYDLRNYRFYSDGDGSARWPHRNSSGL